MRPELLQIAKTLASSDATVLSLDDIAEAIGTLDVSSDEIDALFTWLEQAGRRVGDPRVGVASAALPAVLSAARGLRTELGRVPRIAEIAERAQLSQDAVQRALLFARILQR